MPVLFAGLVPACCCVVVVVVVVVVDLGAVACGFAFVGDAGATGVWLVTGGVDCCEALLAGCCVPATGEAACCAIAII
jgi:hypothetical protein